MAAIGFLGGWPTRYVLEKIGTELRGQYMPVITQPLPERLQELAARLTARP